MWSGCGVQLHYLPSFSSSKKNSRVPIIHRLKTKMLDKLVLPGFTFYITFQFRYILINKILRVNQSTVCTETFFPSNAVPLTNFFSILMTNKELF